MANATGAAIRPLLKSHATGVWGVRMGGNTKDELDREGHSPRRLVPAGVHIDVSPDSLSQLPWWSTRSILLQREGRQGGYQVRPREDGTAFMVEMSRSGGAPHARCDVANRGTPA